MGVRDCALYPLFTEELLDLMRTLIPPERQERVATAIVLRARRIGSPGGGDGSRSPHLLGGSNR